MIKKNATGTATHNAPFQQGSSPLSFLQECNVKKYGWSQGAKSMLRLWWSTLGYAWTSELCIPSAVFCLFNTVWLILAWLMPNPDNVHSHLQFFLHSFIPCIFCAVTQIKFFFFFWMRRILKKDSIDHSRGSCRFLSPLFILVFTHACLFPQQWIVSVYFLYYPLFLHFKVECLSGSVCCWSEGLNEKRWS